MWWSRGEERTPIFSLKIKFTFSEYTCLSFNAFYFFLLKFGLVNNKGIDFNEKQSGFRSFLKDLVEFQEEEKSSSWKKNSARPESQFINQPKDAPSSCPHWETLVSRLS